MLTEGGEQTKCWPFRCCPERSKRGGGGPAGPAIVSDERGSFQIFVRVWSLVQALGERKSNAAIRIAK